MDSVGAWIKNIFILLTLPPYKLSDMIIQMDKFKTSNTIIHIDAQKEGYPDGMTIDAEGKLWIAHWGGWQVTRWDPSSGEKLNAIKLPVSQVTSVCFGGEHFDEMFITSARRGLTSEQLQLEPLSGATFRVLNTGYKGLPFYRFKNA